MPKTQLGAQARINNGVVAVNAIPVSQLCHLLKEYSIRLRGKIEEYQVKHKTGKNAAEILSDIEYLSSQTRKLVNKASVQHEHTDLSEAEEFELELYMFDAEGTLRDAERLALGAGNR